MARRYHISRGLLANWPQQVRRGALAVGNHAPMFMPVQMLPGSMEAVARVPSSHEPPASTQAIADDRRIEISLPDGTCIRVGADVGLAALRRVIAAVRR